ncbi:MAG TPA: putative porin [Xanthomonadaceae bacterium]|nr:putative porin [Xanthomonadaceae bacterium]
MMKRLSILVLVLGSGVAVADDPFDPMAEEARPAWRPFADLLLRGDRVTGLPGGRADLERARSRLRLGLTRSFDGGSEFGVALRAAAGSDSNRDNRMNLDNQRSNGVWLDQLWLRHRFSAGLELELGKAPLPLRHSPLWWDADLRPAGVGMLQRHALGDFDELVVALGAWRNQHLYNDRSRLLAAQLTWKGLQSSPVGIELTAGWLRFLDIDRLAQQGLARGNRVAQGRYLSSYRLLHVQAAALWRVADMPAELRVDWVRNLGATQRAEDSAARASLVLGDRRAPRQWEAGFAWQRFQRDAVLAAFTDDDWWFHTAARGVMPWVGYGFDSTWSIRLAGFRERRDDLDRSTRRWLLDLAAQW